jgi:hypothetical protein
VVLIVKFIFDFLFLLDLNFGLGFVTLSPEFLLKSLFVEHLFGEFFLKFRGTLDTDANV